MKEKFGLLRIYIDGETREMTEVIHLPEEASATVCEDCGGEEGFLQGEGYMATRCDGCQQAHRDMLAQRRTARGRRDLGIGEV